jgi:uncharacterized protein with von Willebrand factor type A (vWA) domain
MRVTQSASHNNMQITVANGYLPPSDQSIQAAADQAELKLKVPDFVRDVCNITAGGNFISQSEIADKIQQEWESTKIRKEFSGKKYKFIRSDNNKAYDTFVSARTEFFKDKEKLASRIQHTINSMEHMDVPGNTPLEQSVNLINLLLKQRYGNKSPSSSVDSDEVLNDLLSTNNINQAKNNLDTARHMSDEEQDLLSQVADLKNKPKPQEDQEPQSGQGGKCMSPGTETGFTAKGKRILKNAMHLADSQLADILKISRKMKSFSKLKTSKIQEFTPDVEGSQVRNRVMQNYGELSRIKASQYAQKSVTPNLFNYRAVTNQYMIRERGRFLEKKQLLYVLVDCSGSMTEDGHTRINMAAGILVNRLMAVSKGDASVYWCFFDTVNHAVTFVDDKSKAQESISKILEVGQYDGGGTNFDVAIKSAVEHIESLKETMQFAKPEIFMVTDGGCHCSLKRDDLKGVKLHAGIVAAENPAQLKALVGATGGAYIEFCK